MLFAGYDRARAADGDVAAVERGKRDELGIDELHARWGRRGAERPGENEIASVVASKRGG